MNAKDSQVALARSTRLLQIIFVAVLGFSVAVHAEPPSMPPSSDHADMKTYLADVARALAAEWPDNRMVTVVCHGHSVPAGYFRTPEIRPFDSYPHLAHRLIQSHYPTGMIEVIRTAIGGEHAEAGAARFAEDVLAKKPDVVCIDYALNDRSIGLVRARAAWEQMIRAALVHDVKVILLTPTGDTNARDDTPDQSLERHAQQIRDLAATFGVGLADSYAAFTKHQQAHGSIVDLMSQSNHPNRKGHEMVAALVADWFVTPGRDKSRSEPEE